MISLRVRSRVSPDHLGYLAGKVLGDQDYDVLLKGACRVDKPDGRPLCVYLPGGVYDAVSAPGVYDVLHGLRGQVIDNRGLASGTPRIAQAHDNRSRTRTRKVASSIIGAVDPGGQQRYCRLTAWTGRNLPEWEALQPLLQDVARQMFEHVPARYAAQAKLAAATDPAWVVPGTPFSTVTVNNSYATGVHTDKGDLDAGFSTLAVLKRGSYTGGELVFPEWRVAVGMRNGDLLLMDAHDWHGNTELYCGCAKPMLGACARCGAERISVVAYMRTKIAKCGSPDQELRKAARSKP